jgi:hypothetical protein
MRDGGYQLVVTHGGATFANLVAKWYYRFEFVGDWPIPLPMLVGLLGCLLLLAVYRGLGKSDEIAGAGAAGPTVPTRRPSIQP